MRKPSSSDCQWYDRAMELGALSPEKTDANYAGHYLYQGRSGKYGHHVFQDLWDSKSFLIVDFRSRKFAIIETEEEPCQK